jgi:hypothetical protein
MLDAFDRLPGIALVPGAVELLGRGPELDDEVAGEICRLDLASLFLRGEGGRLHRCPRSPGVGAPDEAATVETTRPSHSN